MKYKGVRRRFITAVYKLGGNIWLYNTISTVKQTSNDDTVHKIINLTWRISTDPRKQDAVEIFHTTAH